MYFKYFSQSNLKVIAQWAYYTAQLLLYRVLDYRYVGHKQWVYDTWSYDPDIKQASPMAIDSV